MRAPSVRGDVLSQPRCGRALEVAVQCIRYGKVIATVTEHDRVWGLKNDEQGKIKGSGAQMFKLVISMPDLQVSPIPAVAAQRGRVYKIRSCSVML
jgi:hypothetical protein